jgi:nitronate monooxygenase
MSAGSRTPSTLVLSALSHPIVLAPLAGGPSTPALAAAVSEAGGLGFLAAGYRKAEAVREDIEAVRAQTRAPFGVNVFVPGAPAGDGDALRAYVAELGPGAGAPRFDDDDWEAKLEVLRDAHVPVVSFTFGCPSREVVDGLRSAGAEVWVTATDRSEAREARDAGADALVLQGVEAGGHRATFVDRPGIEGIGLLALLRLVVAADMRLPLVATGGIGDGAALAAVLTAGAAVAQLGTAFLLAPEAGTHPAHRLAIASEAPTALTRAFTGRLARGVANGFMAAHPDAPIAYPEIHHATEPLRAAARDRGDAEGFNLWAGQAHALARELPAGEIVRTLGREAARRLGSLG